MNNRFYYQYKLERLPCMTLTIHALLHVTDTIETIGPVWAWWSFPIERQCGRFQQKIKSRKHPYTNLDNYLLQDAQLKQIKTIYTPLFFWYRHQPSQRQKNRSLY